MSRHHPYGPPYDNFGPRRGGPPSGPGPDRYHRFDGPQVALQYMIKDIPKEAWVDITITILDPIRIRSIRTVVLRINSVIQMPLAGMIRVMGMEISKVR